MKRIATILVALGILTKASVASAWEFTPAQHCQTNQAGSLTYAFADIWAGGSGSYVVCGVTRTYYSVTTARADVSNPSDATTSGYVNFTSEDGNYLTWNSGSTSAVGAQQISFAAISNPTNVPGFVTFDMNLPANGVLRGFHTN